MDIKRTIELTGEEVDKAVYEYANNALDNYATPVKRHEIVPGRSPITWDVRDGLRPPRATIAVNSLPEPVVEESSSE